MHPSPPGPEVHDATGHPAEAVSPPERALGQRTEGERAREELERLRHATASAGMGTWELDPSTGALTTDAQVRAAFALPPEMPVDYALFARYLHPAEAEVAAATVKRALDPSGPGGLAGEFRILGADGVPRWIRLTATTIFAEQADGTRRATRMVGTVLDVSDRRRAERTLRRLAEAALAIARVRSLDEALREITDQARGIVGAGLAVTGLLSGEEGAPPLTAISRADRSERAAAGPSERTSEDREHGAAVPRPPIALEPMLPFVASGPLRLTQEELERHPVWTVIAAREGDHRPTRGWLAAPLADSEGQTIGLIELFDRRYGDFTAADQSVLVQLAQMASAAVENVRLHDAERAARTAAERDRADLEGVLQVVPIGIGIARDPACADIRVNPAFAEQLGVSPDVNASKSGEESAALPFKVMHEGREVRPDELVMQRAAAEDATFNGMEFDVVHEDGRVVRLLEYAAPLHDATGRVRGAVGAFVDVTERQALFAAEREARQRADDARRSAERAAVRVARLQALTAALAEAFTPEEVTSVAVRAARDALDASSSCVAVLEPNADHGLLRVVAELGYPAALAPELRAFPLESRMPMAEAVRSGEPVLLHTREERQRRFPELAAALPGFNRSLTVPLRVERRIVGAMALGFTDEIALADDDVDYLLSLAGQCASALERARRFAAEREAQEERERLLARAEEARVGAEEANAAKSHFLATMSHELRQPLNAIQGYAELLSLGIRGEVNDQQREDLARIRRSSQHLLSVINDILQFARVEAGRLAFDLATIPLDEVMRGLEPLVAPQIAARQLRYTYHGCAAELRVRADRERLVQIVVNLLVNAIKYTNAGGTVDVWCERAHDAPDAPVHIVVRDSGIGIAPEKLPRIFDPFVQVHRGLSRPEEGVGLGLAISHDLAVAMGGTLLVESELGAGSTFTLVLPPG